LKLALVRLDVVGDVQRVHAIDADQQNVFYSALHPIVRAGIRCREGERKR
jgi:hypothetical protein